MLNIEQTANINVNVSNFLLFVPLTHLISDTFTIHMSDFHFY